MTKSKEQQLIDIKNAYRAAHNNAFASLRTMLEWASENTLYKIDMAKAWSRAVDEFADALRGEMTTDGQGHEIRVNLPFLDSQLGWQWDTRDTISREHQELNTQHTWRMCYSDVKAGVLTANDYSERHPDEPPLQFSLDFAGALADDGITAAASIVPEPLAVPLHPGLADSEEQPEPSRPSSPRANRVSRLPRVSRRPLVAADAAPRP
jgi:hypothetical protein